MERTTNKLTDMISSNEKSMTPSRPPLQCSLGSLIRTSRSKEGSRKKSKRVNTAVLGNTNPLMTPPKKEERRRFLFQSNGLIREKDVLTRRLNFDGDVRTKKSDSNVCVSVRKNQKRGGYYLSHMSHVLIDIILTYCNWKSLVQVSSVKLLRERVVLDTHWRPIYRNAYGRWKSKHKWLARKRPPYCELFARKEIQKMLKGSHSLEMLVRFDVFVTVRISLTTHTHTFENIQFNRNRTNKTKLEQFWILKFVDIKGSTWCSNASQSCHSTSTFVV